jgi:N-acetyl-beta-hexosaminidase
LIHVDKRALPAIGTDESYSLKITPQQININAPNTTGALHAFETLIQLLQKNNNAFSFPCVVLKTLQGFNGVD